MKIKIDKVKVKSDLLSKTKIVGYRADFIELPGSPRVGTGKTIEEAIATLFIRNLKNLDRLDMNYLEINDKPYEDYIKNDR
jgi:hypothetical protein